MSKMIHIPSGGYHIGTNLKDGFIDDKEGPKTKIYIESFEIAETCVTNSEFLQFVKETGYITEAEKFGWSFVFHYFLSNDTKSRSKLVPNMANWYAVSEANWKHPEGKESAIVDRLDHPVVHISRNDAIAYCIWANKRLPTEAEWEIAAKGGTDFDKYPWGDNLLEENKYHCNIWQGDFPIENTQADGFASTSPVKSYEPNCYGIYQMIGNVWEWCVNPSKIELKLFDLYDNNFFWEKYQTIDDNMYATKGGSFLCHQSYCKRYRIAARNQNSGMSSANNIGFRCIRR